MVSMLDKLRGQRAKLDQQMASEELKARIQEHGDLMRQRAELVSERDMALGAMFTSKEAAGRKAREARAVADAALAEATRLAVNYQQAQPRWDNRIAEMDTRIRATRPAELDNFLEWLQQYANALTGSYTYGSVFMDRQHELIPLMEGKDSYGAPRAVIDREALAQTRELLAGARERAQQLAVTASPETFAKDLSKLRAETEAELTRLRS